MFGKMFGRDKNKRDAAQSSQAVGSASPPPSAMRTRKAHCDICGQDRNAHIVEDDRFGAGTIFLDGDSKETILKASPFVGGCPTCDIDVCDHCAKWERRPLSKRKDAVLCHWPICPRCNGDFRSKSSLDGKRILDDLTELKRYAMTNLLEQLETQSIVEPQPQSMSSIDSRIIMLRNRLRRRFVEEEAYFEKTLLKATFDDLRKDVLRFTMTSSK